MPQPISEADELQGSRAVAGFHVRYYRFAADRRLPRHTHQLPALVVPLAGGFRCRMQRDALDSRPGDLLTVPPDIAHSERIGPRGAASLLVVPSEGRAAKLGTGSLFRRLARFRGPAIQPLLDKVVREYRSRDDLSAIGLESALLELVVAAGRQAPSTGDVRAPWLAETRELLDGAFDQALDLSVLARRAGVSRAHLARSFRGAFGCSIGEYLRRRRLDRAAKLLTDSQMPLADVALSCGFYDQSHLCRHFRRRMGTTPSAWRAGQHLA